MQRGAEKHRGDCFAIFAVIRRASSLVSSLAADRSAWRWRGFARLETAFDTFGKTLLSSKRRYVMV